MGNELRSVVAADEPRCRVEAGQLLQYGHHILGLTAPAHTNGQAKAPVLIDHVQKLEPPTIDGGVELEVHRPHLVRVLGPVTPHRNICGPCPLSLPGSGPLQAFLPPEPLHPLVIDGPALPPQQAVGHPPATADVLSGNLLEALAQLGLLDIDNLAPMALGAAVLPRHPADKALRSPATRLQDRDGPAATFRAKKLPSARSLSMAFSSSASARSFLSRAFSFSS